MLKQFTMWAFICTTAPFVRANQPTDIDSIEYSISPRLLDEVVVKASPVINKTDGKVIRPDKEMLRMSTDGVDLLRKLQLSRITVNPLTNNIEVVGGGDVLLCINGIESTSAQIAAIRPQDIIRIEYHDNPGIRYGGATIVIDYITSRHQSGGNLNIDAFEAIAGGRFASIDNLAGQYNHGRSVWSANISYFGQQKDKWQRDYDETWYYPDATLVRHEEGLPVTVSEHRLESTINYNYQLPTGDIFNARLGFNLNDVPNKEEGDRMAWLQTSGSVDPILVAEHTEEHLIQPNVGLFYQHNMPGGQSLIFDTQGSYLQSRMSHKYSENGVGEDSRVFGDKYSLKLLSMYENRTGSRVWSVAVSNNSSFLRNTYRQEDEADVRINQTETSLMAEYGNRFGNWGLTGNLKVVYHHIGQSATDLDNIFILPALTLSYRPVDKLFVRYSVSLDYKMPTAAELSDIEQPIQSGMIRRGNSGLKPFRVINQAFDISFENSFIGINPRVEYRHEHKPIMESVIYENEQFVRTYFNQRSFQRLIVGGTISVKPWREHLSIMAEPMLTRYFSRGLDYYHCHNIFRVGFSVDFNYGNWLVYGNILSGPMNYMYGEEINEEKDMNQIMVGYKRDKWSLSIGVFNAFVNDYWMETRNLSALTPYMSKAHSNRNSSYLAIRFSLSLDFGRKGREVDIHANDLDSDSGILTGTK